MGTTRFNRDKWDFSGSAGDVVGEPPIRGTDIRDEGLAGPRQPASFLDIVSIVPADKEAYDQFKSGWDSYKSSDFALNDPVRLVEGALRRLAIRTTVSAFAFEVGAAIFGFFAQHGLESLAGSFKNIEFHGYVLGLSVLVSLILLILDLLRAFISWFLEASHIRHLKVVIHRLGSEPKPIWLGSGQIQFACGPSGILVKQDDGFRYQLKWEKVKLIFDGDRRSELPSNFVRHLRGSDDGRNALRSINAQLGSVRDDGRSRGTLRVRYFGDLVGKISDDELVVPKRFFMKAEGAIRSQDFLAYCWAYKLVQEGKWPD